MKKHRLIMLMGPTGTSKTVVANKIAKIHENCSIISKSKMRKEHCENLTDSYFERVNTSIRNNQYTVVIDDYTTLETRETFFKNVRIPQNTKIVGIWFEASLSTAKKSNRAKPKEEQVPEHTIEKMFKYKVSPMDYEPFDEVLFLNLEQDISIYKNAVRIRQVLDALADL